jgi:glycosyltransferase involved in cell wall biosynthesis
MAFDKLQQRNDRLMNHKLLTIAIPTYNRAAYLDTCLSHISQQLCGYESLVEIIVSDNCSSDNTIEVAQSFFNGSIDFRYIRNDENIGPDRNFVQCFTLAKGKYVLLLGDDDILLDGALAKIIAILQKGEYGVVYLNSYGFKNDFLFETPAKRKDGVIYCQTSAQFLQKVNYWLTFASGNICNKSLLPIDFDPSKYVGTNLVQVYWYLSALFAAKQNVYVAEYLVAAKTANTGGYKLCKVFGKNFCLIFDHFIEKGISARNFDIIKKHLVLSFFPNLILILRSGSTGFKMDKEDYYNDLKSVFSKYPYFWIVTVPAIMAPVALARTWMRAVMLVDRLIWR